MYHRPVDVFPTRQSSRMAPRSRSELPGAHNENLMKGASSSFKNSNNSKTPAGSSGRSRRAFGDISNKKGSNGLGGSKENQSSKPQRPSIVLKPQSNNSSNQRSSKTQFRSRIPTLSTSKNSGNSLSKRPHPWAKGSPQSHKPKARQPLQSSSSSQFSLHSSSNATERSKVTTKAPTPSLQPSRRQTADYLVPTRTPFETLEDTTLTSKSRTSTKASTSSRGAISVEPVPDVELPAGRLWADQLQDLDDDDLSTSSMGETLDRRTMWEDWRDAMHQQWKEEQEAADLEDERIIQEQIDRVLKEDGQETGLEQLIDWVEDLTLNNKRLNDGTNMDLQIEDDDWSEPASSLDGALGLDFEL